MTVSGDSGKPLVLIRNKAGKIALGIGLENEEPTIAARNAKGDLVKVPLPKE